MAAVQEAVEKRKFVKVQYQSDIHEFLTVTTLIKNVEAREGGFFLELASGQEIPFDQLVKVGEVASNRFTPRDFTCNC